MCGLISLVNDNHMDNNLMEIVVHLYSVSIVIAINPTNANIRCSLGAIYLELFNVCRKQICFPDVAPFFIIHY